MLLKFIFLLVLTQLVIVSTTNDSDDIADFEFDNLDLPPSDDYYYNEDVLPHGFVKTSDSLVDDINTSSFETKEQKLKKILLKTWANGEMRRKFSEVLPILRVLSTTQRVALASLISAQATAKPGKELTMKQVSEMFGDRPDLILPLALDIANLVRLAGTSGEDKLQMNYQEKEVIPSEQLLRRSFGMKDDIRSVKMNVPLNTLQSGYMHDDQLHIDEDDVRRIKTRELSDISKSRSSKTKSKNSDDNKHSRKKRSYHEKKLNMTDFNGDGDQIAMASEENEQSSSYDMLPTYIKNNLTLEEIEKLAFESLNGTDFETADTNSTTDENLPTPEKLIYRPKVITLTPYRRKYFSHSNIDRTGACEKFGNVCLRVTDYPMDQIMGSIRRNRHAMTALLAEYRDRIVDLSRNEEVPNNLRRRGDNLSASGAINSICPSLVRYARPQKAKSATGEWKYIVNTGQHTQTLRLEKCSKPQESCTYLTDNFRSRCSQVFNYHRLLSWDKIRGLHVDIFKVPTCCSCQIDGYKEAFPPLYNKPEYIEDYKTSISSIKNINYSPIYNTETDDEDDEENNDPNSKSYYSTGFKFQNQKPFNLDLSPTLLQSASNNKIRLERPKTPKIQSAIIQTSQGLDSYLSPPANKYDSIAPGKRTTTITKRKRPARRDQSVSSSEIQPQTIIPNNNIDITTSRPIRIKTTTPKVIKKVIAKLPNISSSSSSTSSSSSVPNPTNNLDFLNKRINYNYHPIIDFFEDEEDEDDILSDREIDDRRLRIPENRWTPMVNRRYGPY